MNPSKSFLRRAILAIGLLAGMFSLSTGRAQPSAQTGASRYLLIFNTSADMKKRVPAVQTEVNQLLATSLGGRLRPGDSVGVWTFDQDLRIGQFPLRSWRPEDAVSLADAINKFLSKQRYANRTRFDALQPQLNQVIKNSARLTVLIFCDGEDDIKGTPYDASINQVFHQRQADQKKAAQPFVLVLRTQLGEYTGSTMNFPPGMVNVPDFPPLPAPPPPHAPTNTPPAPQATTPTAPPPTTPPPTAPPLIIVGRTVMTNWPSAPAASPARAVSATATNAMAPVPSINPAPAAQTNPIPAPSAIPPTPINPVPLQNAVTPATTTNPMLAIQTNVASSPANITPPAAATPVTAQSSVPKPSTNAVVPSPEASDAGNKHMLVIGGALLFAAGALAAFAVFRRRRTDRGSLITRSMRKD